MKKKLLDDMVKAQLEASTPTMDTLGDMLGATAATLDFIDSYDGENEFLIDLQERRMVDPPRSISATEIQEAYRLAYAFTCGRLPIYGQRGTTLDDPVELGLLDVHGRPLTSTTDH